MLSPYETNSDVPVTTILASRFSVHDVYIYHRVAVFAFIEFGDRQHNPLFLINAQLPHT